MNNYKQYGTHLFISFSEEVPKPITGKNFRILFSDVKQKLGKEYLIKHEIIIEAKSIFRAQFVCDLIICSMCVLEGHLLLGIRDTAVYPLDSNSVEKPLYDCQMVECQTEGFPLACKLAAKISFHSSYVNAVNKFLLSCEIHSTHWVDLDPTHSPQIPLSPFTYDHLRYGYAITLAYSIVEELKLGVNASNEKLSLKNGKWNPEVKKDLERRLISSKIDINDPFIWERRGSKKTLEKRRPITPLKKAPWSYGNVRDCEILLIDAINNISFLRSRIIAHKVDRNIELLSVYDVSNAQRLARRLILESLGFWKLNK
ncbi:MAG: hypothetical protein ACOX7H_03625 [Bacillota bacterium]|jgi:hypothetical protein